MNETTKRNKRAGDEDGVRVMTRRNGGARLLAIGGAALAIVLAVVVLTDRREVDDDVSTPRAPTQAAAQDAVERTGAAARSARRTPGVRPVRTRRTGTGSGAAPPSGEPATNPPQGIDAAEYIAALRAAGETEGLAAFSPPGTRPPVTGVVVPKDYELPEGFVRYYQSTDDGRQLEPILTLSPEYDLVDGSGNPIPLPRDRVVPPELAPPDLPIRMLEVPSTTGRHQGLR